MFGPIMQFRAQQHLVKMAPVCRDDMARFIEDGGMQRHSVMRWMGHRTHPAVENEYEYYDKLRTENSHVFWGIFVQEDGQWQLIGSSSLNLMSGKLYFGAVSGIMIFSPEWWGKGIASSCHRARTLYAFDYLNLAVVRSAVMDANAGSYKALAKCGYVQVGIERNATFEGGRWYNQLNLEMVNPSPDGWRQWWHGATPPKAFKEARKRTLEVLDWAREHVELL